MPRVHQTFAKARLDITTVPEHSSPVANQAEENLSKLRGSRTLTHY